MSIGKELSSVEPAVEDLVQALEPAMGLERLAVEGLTVHDDLALDLLEIGPSVGREDEGHAVSAPGSAAGIIGEVALGQTRQDGRAAARKAAENHRGPNRPSVGVKSAACSAVYIDLARPQAKKPCYLALAGTSSAQPTRRVVRSNRQVTRAEHGDPRRLT